MLNFTIVVLILLSCGYSFELYRSRIAIDYGPRLIGLAVSIGSDTKPLCTLPNLGNLTTLSREILNIAKKKNAKELLLGIPVDSNGLVSYNVKNFNGNLCLNFSRVLSAVASVESPQCKIYLYDERYTTKEAKIRIKSEKLAESTIDAVSAACLLERYLEDRGEGSIDAIPTTYPPPYELEFFDYNIVRNHIKESYNDELSTEKYNKIRMNALKMGGNGPTTPKFSNKGFLKKQSRSE